MTHKQPESNGLGLASLILGILSLTGGSILTGIPAIVTGIMGMKNPETKNMSLAGLIMGITSTVITLLLVLFFLLLIIIGVAASSNGTTEPDYNDSPSSDFFQRRT